VKSGNKAPVLSFFVSYLPDGFVQPLHALLKAHFVAGESCSVCWRIVILRSVLLRQAVIVAVPDWTAAAAAELLVNGEKEAATNTCTKPIRQQKRRHGFFSFNANAGISLSW
jgi:hypothetical protein